MLVGVHTMGPLDGMRAAAGAAGCLPNRPSGIKRGEGTARKLVALLAQLARRLRGTDTSGDARLLRRLATAADSVLGRAAQT